MSDIQSLFRFWWGGPFGALWGGPFEVNSAMTDPLAATSMATFRAMLDEKLPESPQVDPAWKTDYSAPTVTPDTQQKAPDLMSNERAVRETIVLADLTSEIHFAKNGKAAEIRCGSDSIAKFSDISETMALQEAQNVKTVIDNLDKGVRLIVEQLIAQDPDPLMPLGFLTGISQKTHPKTVEMVGIAVGLLSLQLFRLKNHYAIKRPHVQVPNLTPILNMPGHHSFPAGHAAKGHLVATLLGALGHKRSSLHEQLHKAANLVAANRIFAGLHTVADNAAGEVLGRALGHWLLAVAAPDRKATWHGASLQVSTVNQLERARQAAVKTTPDIPHWRVIVAAAAAEWA